MTVGPGGLRASGLPADLGPPVLVESFTEHDVVRHDKAVDARSVQQLSPAQERLPAAGIVLCERLETH
jgi:hypothetical protein